MTPKQKSIFELISKYASSRGCEYLEMDVDPWNYTPYNGRSVGCGTEEYEKKEKMPFDKECSYHFYWIRVNNREKFMKKMYEKGIETGIHYKPVHKMSLYKSKIKLPITEQVANQIVSIPTHPNLTNSEVDKIIHTVNDLYDC